MPVIIPIKDLCNISEISDIAHRIQESIYITKKGYSDVVIMSSELYDKFAYIALEKLAPENVKGQTVSIKAQMKILDTFPQCHQEHTEGRFARKGYRQLLFDHYVAI